MNTIRETVQHVIDYTEHGDIGSQINADRLTTEIVDALEVRQALVDVTEAQTVVAATAEEIGKFFSETCDDQAPLNLRFYVEAAKHFLKQYSVVKK